MKYFRWSEKETLNMSYEKFTMYLSTIPDYNTDEEEPQPEKETGFFNMFDFDSI